MGLPVFSSCNSSCPALQFGLNCSSVCDCGEGVNCHPVTGACPSSMFTRTDACVLSYVRTSQKFITWSVMCVYQAVKVRYWLVCWFLCSCCFLLYCAAVCAVEEVLLMPRTGLLPLLSNMFTDHQVEARTCVHFTEWKQFLLCHTYV